jgi:hypothetical protein
VELHPDALQSEEAADDYARLLALAHPQCRVQVLGAGAVVCEYGPLAAKRDD